MYVVLFVQLLPFFFSFLKETGLLENESRHRNTLQGAYLMIFDDNSKIIFVVGAH